MTVTTCMVGRVQLLLTAHLYVLNFVFISWMHVEITIKIAPMEFYGIWSVLVAMYDCVKSHTCPLLNRISAIS